MAKSPLSYSQSKETHFSIHQMSQMVPTKLLPSMTHTLERLARLCDLAFFFLFHFQPITNVFLWPFKESNQSHYLSKYKGQLSSLFTMCLHSTEHLNILLSEMLLLKIPLTCLLGNHSLTYAVSIGVLVRFHSLLNVFPSRKHDSHSCYPLQLSLRPRLYF